MVYRGPLYNFVVVVIHPKLCPAVYHTMDCSTPDFPLFHYVLEFAQIHVHWVNDAIQPSHPLLPPSLKQLLPLNARIPHSSVKKFRNPTSSNSWLTHVIS